MKLSKPQNTLLQRQRILRAQAALNSPMRQGFLSQDKFPSLQPEVKKLLETPQNWETP